MRFEVKSAMRFAAACVLMSAHILGARSIAAPTADLKSSRAAASASGNSVSLADGAVLAVGGTSGVASNDIWLSIARGTQTERKLLGHLLAARVFHSATLLPDGRVLIAGGQDEKGSVLDTAEIVDPSTGQSIVLDVRLIARAQHTATLLLNGQVLIAGGVDPQGRPVAEAEIWNSYSTLVEPLAARMEIARFLHGADWTAGDEILITGGLDENRAPVAKSERYTPLAQRFEFPPLANSLSDLPRVPVIVESIPQEDARNVPVGSILALRFDRPLEVTSLNEKTVTLFGPDGPVKTKIVVAERGRLLFVTPIAELRPDAAYTLFVHGGKDEAGVELPFGARGFRTTKLSADTADTADAGDPGDVSSDKASRGDVHPPAEKPEVVVASIADDDEIWHPGPQHRRGNWQTGRIFSNSRDAAEIRRNQQDAFVRLPGKARARLEARMREKGELIEADYSSPFKTAGAIGAKLLPGVTSVSGQALRLNGKPLANVAMSIGTAQVRTDANGEFTLANVSVGPQVLVIDGRPAGQTTKDYGRYEYLLDVKAGENELPFTIWMSRIDKQNAVRIASPVQRETVVTHPDIPGLELRIPPGAVIRDADGKIVTEVSITPVPTDKMPFPMPYSGVALFYTIQPGGARILSADGKPLGATIRYPNYSTQPPGAKIELFDYDPAGRGWYTYDTGLVGANGQTIETKKPFVIYQFSATSSASGGGGPGDPGPPPKCPKADPVYCDSGLFIDEKTDLVVKDIQPISVYREYRQNAPNQKSFGIGTNQFFDMYLSFIGATHYAAEAIQVVLSSGVAVVFDPVSGSTTYTNPDTVYESLEPGPMFKARLAITAGGWGNDFAVKAVDGTRYGFSYFQSKLKWTEDRYGNRTTILRDPQQRVSRIVSPNGRWIEYEYSAGCFSCVSKATDHTGRTVRYEYDSPGRLIRVTDTENNVMEYSYDANHRMTQIKDGRQNIQIVNEYYADATNPLLDGRVKKQTYPDQSVFSFAYFFDAALTKIEAAESIDERGSVRRVEYNAGRHMVKDIYAKGTPEEQVWSYERDPVTNLVTLETDPLGRKTKFVHNEFGKVISKTAMFDTAEAVTWNYTYEPRFQQLDTETDPEGRKLDREFDAQGRVIRVTNDLGHSETTTYNSMGQVETVTRIANGQEIVNRFRYESGGMVEHNNAGRVTLYHTDDLGRVTGIKNADGTLSLRYYDGRDLVTKRCDAAGDCANYVYNPNGMLEHFTRGTTQLDFTYDSRDRKKTEGRGAQVDITYEYEPGGEIRKRTEEASGRVMEMTHDALGRARHVEYKQGGAVTRTVDYERDKGNRVKRITDSVAGTLSYTYDDRFNSAKTETGPTGTMTYTYYANGLRQTARPSGGTTITYRYDIGNRLQSLEQASGSGATKPAAPQTVRFEYDEADRRKKLTLANGVTVDYAWSLRGELERLTYKMANGDLIGELIYEYDANGERIAQRGSLARGGFPSARSLPVAADGRLQSDGGTPITWDAEGRLVSDNAKTYIWDDLGQLKEIRDTATSAVLASFEYDPAGRRIQKNAGGTVTRYLHDGANPVQLLNGSNAVQENLLAGGTDEWFARTKGGATAHYLRDALGSTIRLVDQAGVKIVDYTYDAYGATSNDRSSEKNPFQYTGRENDGTGLYYYRARYYNPKWGRFISPDPIGLQGGDNLYLYVGGNPISLNDPTGLIVNAGGFASTVTGMMGSKTFAAMYNYLNSNSVNYNLLSGSSRPDTPAYGGISGFPPSFDIRIGADATKWAYMGVDGKKHCFTLQRIIAHEMAHPAGNASEAAAVAVENAIMKELNPNSVPRANAQIYRPDECGCKN